MSAGGLDELYTKGGYAERHPAWHTEDSPWKAAQILKMIERQGLTPHKICEIGSGAGEILRQLQDRLAPGTQLVGYEISPQAHELALTRARPGLDFKLADFLDFHQERVDLLLLMDVIEHVEDYLSFLRQIQPRGEFKIFHIPLDLSVEWLIRGGPLVNERRSMGHLHYFTKDLAFEALTDTGYEIVDWFYTRSGIDLHYPTWRSVWAKETRVKTGIRKLVQHGMFALDEDLCARLLRGWSLLVLAR